MKNNKLILLLVAIAIVIFPLDPSVLINRIIGMNGHILLYIVFIIVILYLIKGKTLKDKWNNLLRCVREATK